MFPLPDCTFKVHQVFPTAIERPAICRTILKSLRDELPEHHLLSDVFDDLAVLKFHIKRQGESIHKKATLMGTVIVDPIHSLISHRIRTEGGNNRSLAAECVRVATILSLHEVRRLSGPISGYPDLYPGKLQKLLQKKDIDWTGLEVVKLWVLACGAREAVQVAGGNWFLRKFRVEMESVSARVQSKVIQGLQDMSVEPEAVAALFLQENHAHIGDEQEQNGVADEVKPVGMLAAFSMPEPI